MFTNHNRQEADSLYGADIFTHLKYRHEGIGSMLYNTRKQSVMELSLRRGISGGRIIIFLL
jgi:hypothetical protein